MQAVVHAADIRDRDDRDGGVLLMGALFGLYPFLLRLHADGGYRGPKFRGGLGRVCAQVEVEVVSAARPSGWWCCPGAGSSNAPSPGSTGVAAWPRIGSSSTGTRSRSCAAHPSG